MQVAGAKGHRLAYLLDTKGPEVRTAMVRDGKPIELEANQELTLVAVGADYVNWEGYKDEATGRVVAGRGGPRGFGCNPRLTGPLRDIA